MSFLEECISYIQYLQRRCAELEHLAGVTSSTMSCPALPVLSGHPSALTDLPMDNASAVLQPSGSAAPYFHNTAATTAW